MTVDTLLEVLLIGDRQACLDVFATYNSGWSESECDEGQTESCGFAAPGLGAAGFTRAALLAALFAHRRRRPR